MQTVQIESLFVYPIKSLAGVSVEAITFNAFGPVHDRQYMLVDQQHRFVTQRSHPVLSQFSLADVNGHWQVTGPSGSSIVIASNASTETIIDTKVFRHPIQTREKSKEVSQWFSEQLDQLVSLVEFDDLETRVCDFSGHQAPFAFADGFPLLVCNRQSLLDVSERVEAPLTMNRFRPNIVISLDQHMEYDVEALERHQGGSLLFTAPCERCNIPSIDPVTGVFQRSLHQRLKDELKREKRTIFGMNAMPVNLAELRLGDELSVKLNAR